MENSPNLPSCPANWDIRFLCDCKRQDRNISLHQGIARRISTHGVRLLSDHPICEQKKIAMQVMIPSLKRGGPHNIVKIIGNSILTIVNEGMFLTEIEFLHFEENGQAELERHLLQLSGTGSFA